jgi:hypothetical protein
MLGLATGECAVLASGLAALLLDRSAGPATSPITAALVLPGLAAVIFGVTPVHACCTVALAGPLWRPTVARVAVHSLSPRPPSC